MNQTQTDSTAHESLRRFADIMARDGSLTVGDLTMVEDILRHYPYFTLPASMMLKCPDLTDESRRRLEAAVALNAPDSESLMKLIDIDAAAMAQFYPPEARPATPDTDHAIDTFLDRYGDIDPHEQQLLERLIFNPVPDYSQVLAREEPQPSQPASAQDALLDAFLARQDAARPQPEERPRVRPDAQSAKTEASSPLTESLAKIYIKQGRFDKAYEIIYQLSLNNSKKSIYFADQLRFLKKAMLISQANKKKQSRKG